MAINFPVNIPMDIPINIPYPHQYSHYVNTNDRLISANIEWHNGNINIVF